MLFTTETISNEEIKSINNFFNEFEAVETVAPEKAEEETTVVKYLGNRIVRKRNLQQVMQESFFYGANRFGNNFIA